MIKSYYSRRTRSSLSFNLAFRRIESIFADDSKEDKIHPTKPWRGIIFLSEELLGVLLELSLL
jgi:hypothetical protein